MTLVGTDRIDVFAQLTHAIEHAAHLLTAAAESRTAGLRGVSAAGLAVVATAALNGIAVVRAYFLLFTGARHFSSVSLAITARERFVLLTLTALMLGGGLFPQPGIAYLYAVAEQVLQAREPAASQRADAGRKDPNEKADAKVSVDHSEGDPGKALARIHWTGCLGRPMKPEGQGVAEARRWRISTMRRGTWPSRSDAR